MPTINFSIDNSGAPITNNLKAEARDPVTLALDNSVLINAPHTFPLDVALPVSEAKVYLIRLVEVTGGGDVVRNEWVQDAGQSVFNTDPDIIWVVDRSIDDPVSGTTSFAVPALDGVQYGFGKRGVGPLEPGTEWDYLPGGGVQLLGGAKFDISPSGDGDTYYVYKYPPGVTTPKDLFLVVGRGLPQDPLTGTSQYRYSPLAGKNYKVEKRGVGPQRTDEITIVSAGGFDLLGGAIFSGGDTFVAHFYPSVVLQTPPAVTTGKWFDSIVTLPVDTTLNTTYIGKLIQFEAAGSTIKAVLPLIGAFPNNRLLCFKHVGGNASFATIETSGGQDIEFYRNGAVVLNDQVWLGKNEYMYLQHDGTKWVIVMTNWAINEVGSFVDSYTVLPNTVEADGTLISRLEQPRLWFVVEQEMSALIKPETSYNSDTERGYFTDGNGVDSFRLPNYAGVHGFAGTPGVYEPDQVGEFTGSPIQAKAGSHGGSSDAETGTVALLNNSGTTEVTFTIKGSSATVFNPGKVNRPKRIGRLCLIRS